MTAITFTKATKQQAYLRLALEGPAGFGKTYSALEVAQHLVANGKRVALLDTEAGSASKYAHIFDFDHAPVDPPFNPLVAVDAVRSAVASGYGAIVLDSLSHFWNGSGGLLEMVDEIARTKYRGDSHRAWKDAGDLQQQLVDAILRSPIHVIACMRTKKDYVREEVEKDGRMVTRIRAAGTKTVQRDEFDYEFDLVGRFDTPTNLAIVKSRCETLPPETIVAKPGADFARVLDAWLGDGEPLAGPDAQKKIDKLVADLAKADQTRDWADVAEKYALREFRHGRDMLTGPEADRLAAEFKTHLATLKKGAATADPEPAADESLFKVPEGART